MPLAGCVSRPNSAPPPPAAIAVDARVAPPAELLRCPTPVEGFPVDQAATLTPITRAATIRIVAAAAADRAQLERLIGWETGKPCNPTP